MKKKDELESAPATQSNGEEKVTSSGFGDSNGAPVLKKLLNEIGPVDFSKKAGVQKPEDLTHRDYLVCIVKEILEIARDRTWHIRQFQQTVYIFNGQYWCSLENSELRDFLGTAAKKMGWERSRADFYKCREELLKQLYSAAFHKPPEPNRDRVLINLRNGTFQIDENGPKLRDFDPDDFLTYQLPFEFNPDASAPKFQKYLDRVLPDKGLQRLLAEYTGYIFIPKNVLKLEKALMLFGTGANGKSVFFEILRALVGPKNYSSFSIQNLTSQEGYYRYQFRGRLVNYCPEFNCSIENSNFKLLASGEPIEARRVYQSPIVMEEYGKLVFNANSLPESVDHNTAYFRRFLIIPFDVHIPEEEQDESLARRITSNELPGVLNWAVSGIESLLRNHKFSDSDKAQMALKNFRKESDPVAMFLEEYGYEISNETYVPQKSLYQEYCEFVKESGYRHISTIAFGKRLDALGILRPDEKKQVGRVVYVKKKEG